MNLAERTRTAAVLGAFTAVFVALTVSSYVRKSATWDEPQHLTTGYAALHARDYRVDPEHPPFLRLWAALPLLGLPSIQFNNAVLDRISPTDWVGMGQFEFAHNFMYLRNDADRMLYRARFMIVLLGIGLGILIYLWTQEWLGFWPAVGALALYTTEPNLLAHSSLVTTDTGIACFMFGAFYFLWRTTRGLTVGNLTGLTLFVALAVISKFSAVMLAPIILLLLAVHVLRKVPWHCRFGVGQPFTSRRSKAWVAAALVSWLTVTSWAAIWAVYSFRYAPSATADWLYRFDADPSVVQRTPTTAKLVAWVDIHHLLPNVYVQGFLLGQAKAQLRGAFLAGQYSLRGWWYYFPLAFLIKTPVTVILLLIGGLVVCAKRWREFLSVEIFIILPAALYLGTAMAQKLNIGLRHILPVYPLVLLLAAAGIAEFLRHKKTGAIVVLAGLGLFQLFEFGRIYPDYLTFFNQFVGGPRDGYRYLVDSNLDWGQDLKPLKKWMDQHGIRSLGLAYFGTADPAYYGMQCTYLPGSPFFAEKLVRAPRLPGYVAVSATILSGVYLDVPGQAFYRRLWDREPVARIGNSINVYRFEQPWWP